MDDAVGSSPGVQVFLTQATQTYTLSPVSGFHSSIWWMEDGSCALPEGSGVHILMIPELEACHAFILHLSLSRFIEIQFTYHFS